MKKYITKPLSVLALFLFSLGFTSCTDLVEKPYDKISYETFYQTKDDVVRSFLRTYEHGYWSINSAIYHMQENTADQLMTLTRENHWYDGGTYVREHNHTWTPEEAYLKDAWNALFTGITLANNSIEDLQGLNPAEFDMTAKEIDQFVAELRVMRAWYYIKALDLFRNIPVFTKYKTEVLAPPQVTPKDAFTFIETELLDAISNLGQKGDVDVSANRWTKAGAASLLARLYLNGKVYTGDDHFSDCAQISQKIIDGEYGQYAVENRWDAPFDYNNDKSDETIFAFPGSFARTRWHYNDGMYWWSLPFNANRYFEFEDWGQANPRFGLQPGRNVDDVLYEFASGLGQPYVKFQKYADDVRLTKYKNLGGNKREGMFLFGYLEYGAGEKVKSDVGKDLYIRDAVGQFGDLGPGQYPEIKTSSMTFGDQNSGVYHVKYPMYKSTDSEKMESDYAEVRLSEIYYTLAECKFREGDISGAEELLNTVRKRYYPVGSESLYDGELTEVELLDEWGREFLAEGRRRTDLVRWDKFTTTNWWDKQPDGAGKEYLNVFPISNQVLSVSQQLKQNPGY